jgi:hypothetical protein
LVAAVVAGLEGAVVVGGLSAIGAGLYSIGIPKDSVLQHESALKAGKFLLLAHGSKDEIEPARSVLAVHKPEAVEVHAAKAA